MKNKNLTNAINLRCGKIIYNDFHIDVNVSLSQQEMFLDEDLLQIEFPNNYLVDVGWYGGRRFVINVIKDYDWENPVLEKVIPENQIKTFYQQLDEAIQFVDSLNKSK